MFVRQAPKVEDFGDTDAAGLNAKFMVVNMNLIATKLMAEVLDG